MQNILNHFLNCDRDFEGFIVMNFVSISVKLQFLCPDINECATNTADCHSDANCTNVEGSFDCSCKTGYTGNGTYCEGNHVAILSVQYSRMTTTFSDLGQFIANITRNKFLV